MSEKEIVIPISKIKTRPDLDFEKKFHKEVEFQVNEIEHDFEEARHNMKVLKEGQIAVKFPKFIQLIATHEFEEIIDKHKSEDVIISSDLLVDLAGSSTVNDEMPDNRFSFVFLGLILGLVIGAILFLFLIK
jgi:hypothetical protein